MASAPIGRRLVSSRARASPPSPLVAHIDMLDLVLTSPAVRVRRQHWPRHCLRQDVPVRRAQRHRPGRQRYLEVDEPGGLEEKGSPCLLVQAPQCFGCYIQTVYRSYWALTERSPLFVDDGRGRRVRETQTGVGETSTTRITYNSTALSTHTDQTDSPQCTHPTSHVSPKRLEGQGLTMLLPPSDAAPLLARRHF